MIPQTRAEVLARLRAAPDRVRRLLILARARRRRGRYRITRR
ncbi:hypothetical protein [Micromonospora sp. WMMD1082]|nr:hypothetical protein [Micromonospora sp. WMMD1082]MDG4796188.1 hypothetical protein [Micromonospora sp. WMMD1082]